MASAIRMTFPMSVGASAVLLPDRPTPDAVLATMQRHQPTMFGGVPTLYAALLANPRIGPGAGSQRLRRCISAGEALPARYRPCAGASMVGVRHPRRHRLDRDAAHLRVATAPTTSATARRASRCRAMTAHRLDEHGGARAERRGRRAGGARPVARPRATGTSATSRAAPSAASGRIPATPISAMPTAITATAAAATRC